MTRADKIAIILSLLGVIGAFLVHEKVFEGLAHLEDEMAYAWQAQVMARGDLTLPSPPSPKSFLVPFVVDYEGQRFGKYPLGWPALLALGINLGARGLVNPLLGGVGVWLTYRLGKRTFSELVGLLAAGLMITSPFFLMNSGSLLSHPMGLVLSAGFALCWFNAFGNARSSRTWLYAILGGACLGTLAMTRPMTAVGVGLPFAVYGIYLLIGSEWKTRWQLLSLGAIALGIGSIQLAWQYIATGDPFFNLYTLWWEYDKIGFGPGYGVLPEGHSLSQAITTTRQTFQRTQEDIFGWWKLSWIFLLPGLVAIYKNLSRRIDGLLIGLVFPSLVLVYLVYWIGAFLFGPRYFYEGFYSLTIFSGAGIALLAGWPYRPEANWQPKEGWGRVRSIGVGVLLALLVGYNLISYTPSRFSDMRGLYGVEQARIEPFLNEEVQDLAPALIIVHPKQNWIEYGTLIELSSPYYDSPFIIVHARGAVKDRIVISAFPERQVLHYYPDEPDKLYEQPRQ